MDRRDAVIEKYLSGGYCIRIAGNVLSGAACELETDTVHEALAFARNENCTRVYSYGNPDAYVTLQAEGTA